MGLLSAIFGGSSKSSSTSTQSTTNNYDQRQVNDAGGGVIGSGSVDNSLNYQAFTDSRDQSMSFTDFSNRSQSFSDSRDMSTSFADSRDLSQRFTDLSDRSTTISTDGGAFDVVRSVADGLNRIGLAQTDAAREIATRADAAGNGAMTLAMRAQQDAAGFNELAAGRAFDLARSSAAQAFASSGDAIGFTRDTFGQVVSLARDVIGQAGDQAKQVASTANAAYASASDTSSGNKTLLYAGVAAVALVGVVAAFGLFRR